MVRDSRCCLTILYAFSAQAKHRRRKRSYVLTGTKSKIKRIGMATQIIKKNWGWGGGETAILPNGSATYIALCIGLWLRTVGAVLQYLMHRQNTDKERAAKLVPALLKTQPSQGCHD